MEDTLAMHVRYIKILHKLNKNIEIVSKESINIFLKNVFSISIESEFIELALEGTSRPSPKLIVNNRILMETNI